MASNDEAAAAFKAAALACNVHGDELGELAAYLSSMPENERKYMPVDDYTATIRFVRTKAAARDAGAGGGGTGAGSGGVHASGQDVERQRSDQQQQTAEAEELLSEATHSNVVRLVDSGKTVGSACLVIFRNKRFLLTSRHGMKVKPGKCIDVSSFTAYGCKLRHLASFPGYDVSVLLLPDDSTELPDELRGAIPFMVTGGTGLMIGLSLTLIGFPSAADTDVKRFEELGLPITATGKVCWLSEAADEALGTYKGTFPNCSGGAVAYGAAYRYLAGLHVGIIWHKEGTSSRDSRDQGGAGGSGSCAPAAAGGELVVETDTWSEEPAARTRKRRPNLTAEAALEHDVQHLLANLWHKECLGVFVPAHVLVRLLQRCFELLPAALDEDQKG